MDCGFSGNPDIYGIGIRIGYYTQALAVWFANFFLLQEAKTLRTTNHLFLFALVIAGSLYAHDARETYAAEAFLLLQIFLCVGFVSVMETTRYTSRFLRRSRHRLVLRAAVITPGLIFNVCFWWRGLDIMKPTPCTETPGNSSSMALLHRGTYACYGAKTNLYGWMRTAMKVLSLALFGWITHGTTLRDACELFQDLQLKKIRAEFVNFAMFPQVAQAARKEFSGPTHVHKEESTEQPQEVQDREGNQKLAGALQLPCPRHDDFRNIVTSSTPESSVPIVRRNTDPPLAENQTSPSTSKSGNRETRPVTPTIFEKVKTAEEYLDSVFSICEKKPVPNQSQQVVRSLGGLFSFHISIPRRRVSHKPPYLTCLGSLLRSTWTNKPCYQLRLKVELHMIGLGNHPFGRWPRLLHQMCQLCRTKEPPDWREVAIASDAKLSQIPLKKSVLVWAWTAIETFIIFVALVVQVELTIHWNNISDLQSLTSLGQLIPFILGVGGLLQVLWKKWQMLKREDTEAESAESMNSGEYEVALKQYLTWKHQEEVEDLQAQPAAVTIIPASTNAVPNKPPSN